MISPRDALARLRDGNQRFVADARQPDTISRAARRRELASGQSPFAVVLGCADSRVPAEIVFDQDLGDLFVVRVAGNIVAPSQMESIEFAVEQFECALVVVLGHSSCGAVRATLDVLDAEQDGAATPRYRSLVDRIRLPLSALIQREPDLDSATLLGRAVRENVRASVAALRDESEVLAAAIDSEKLLVVGAEYSLDTGVVDFFDETENPA